MWSPASVVVCALFVLGRSESKMPRIELIDVAPAEVSFNAEGFVQRETRTIYLVTSSAVFQNALRSPGHCSPTSAMRKLASILAHEDWHLRNGPDEQGAYEHQLLTLIRLGLHPGSGVFSDVQTSMRRVVEARKRARLEGVLARREP
jgi:hypothetical protein